jgi:tRNA pseudouridine-54 N-methylase
MKAKTRIMYAVWHMRQARAEWELEKSLEDHQPLLTAAADKPEVVYLPGTGFRIDAVVWHHEAEYIIDHHEKLTADYQSEVRRLKEWRAIVDEVNVEGDIPF